ncbi:hypothetical protein SAVIM40S_05286 [Streptomyces avidinii]
MRVIAAQVISDSECWMRRSYSRACLRACMTQASDLSTTQRRGRTTNPTAFFGRPTVFNVRFRYFFAQSTS